MSRRISMICSVVELSLAVILGFGITTHAKAASPTEKAAGRQPVVRPRPWKRPLRTISICSSSSSMSKTRIPVP